MLKYKQKVWGQIWQILLLLIYLLALGGGPTFFLGFFFYETTKLHFYRHDSIEWIKKKDFRNGQEMIRIPGR
jgi:hypothetical protein